MKKFIATAVAAGALAAGGAASAQDLGNIIANVLGFGGTTQAQVYQGQVQQGQVYADQYGRHFYYDQYGRQVYMQNSQQQQQQQQQIVGYDSWGRPVYGTTSNTQSIVGYDNWGRPVYGHSGQTGSAAYGSNYGYGTGSVYGGTTNNYSRSWDRDGDGVPNSQDRWPDDPRYW